MTHSKDNAGRPAATPVPGERRGHILSDGRYRVLITDRGTGTSACGDLALTRWAGDRLTDADGFFLILREPVVGTSWSAGLRPALRQPDTYAAHFTDGRATFVREDAGLVTTLEVAVVPGRDAELRRLTLENRSGAARTVDLTSCLEAVLNHREADRAHPGFSKLFVETFWRPEARALLARRRPRGADEAPQWMVHWIAAGAEGEVSHASERAAFLGRGRTLAEAAALAAPGPLTGGTGAVLDPVLALRTALTLAPGARRTVTVGLAAALDEAGALATCAALAGAEAVDAAFEAAERQARADREACGLDAPAALEAARLAVDLAYGAPLPAAPQDPAQPLPALPGLGGAPRLVVDLDGAEGPARGEAALAALALWHRQGLDARVALVGPAAQAGLWAPKLAALPDPGRAAYLAVESLGAAGLHAVHRHARAVVPGTRPPVAASERVYAPLRPAGPQVPPPAETVLDNGLGGFSPDGREYRLRILPGPDGLPVLPPMPWSNVLANETFGLIATERGLTCTWNLNSRLRRLTPWLNDPIGDPLPEALFIRDEAERTVWSPMPGPAGRHLAFTVRHGFGATVWESQVEDLAQTVTVFVDPQAPVRYLTVRLENRGGRTRRLGLVWGAELVLAESPERSKGLLDVRREGAELYAWHTAPGPFHGQVAFATALGGTVRASGDRAAYLGPDGDPAAPAAAFSAAGLVPGADVPAEPGFALQSALTLAPGQTATCVFVFGEAPDLREARRLAATAPRAEAVLAEVRAFWEDTLSGLRITTPEPALDVMVNGWLAYQNLACRMWGRTAYYQSGGAFGYRDQLQDSAGLLFLRPDLTRRQLLLHAAHQFVEGDVLHWWHPPVEEGIRTRFSDDLLWLPLLTATYLRSTGDWAVLDEVAPYLTAPALAPGQDEAYLAPVDSGQRGDLYDHCCRALDLALSREGVHGLPLMGTGDWNDGMNRVGREGRGESVWMAFFLYAILEAFEPLCLRRGDEARVLRHRARREALTEALEASAWDGGWYRRAYFDDGTPLGGAANTECRIDCLAQAWATLSGAVPPARAEQALAAMEEQLVDEQAHLIRLLTPAFDRCPHDPGYIKGYLPGVRENGGQYTHGALWAVKAIAASGRRDRAAQLLTMMSPVSHTATPERVAVYQTEPYVVAADVYGVAPHTGRGGWTWYTGSAGWFYRVAVEDVLGFTLEGGLGARLDPRLPERWPSASIRYRDPRSGSVLDIQVTREAAMPTGVLEAWIDGAPLTPTGGAFFLPFGPAGAVRTVRVRVGA